MNRPDQHPDTEWLDQLRAGLLDDNPARKSEIESHLEHCEKCRQLYGWPEAIASQYRHAGAVEKRLDQARRSALARPPRSPLRRIAPLATAAAMALIAIVSVNQWHQIDTTETQIAAGTPGEVPEVYEDLDFYLWLADHKAARDSST